MNRRPLLTLVFGLFVVALAATMGAATTHIRLSATAPGEGEPRALAADQSISIPVAEGNHRVTLVFDAQAESGGTTVLAESRQLMLETVAPAPGELLQRSFIVNVRTPALAPPPEYAPGGTEVLLNARERDLRRWDALLTLQFIGASASVAAVTVEPAPADTPTLFLLGDSTVTDQPSGDYASWGQMLPRFLDGRIAVANHAESGETLKSFLTAHRFTKVLSQLRDGDTVLLQFGHNDSKAQWPQTYLEPGTTWPAYLRAYLAEIRRRGAVPILVTSMERRSFDDAGRIRSSHGDYPRAVRELAAAEGVALIDLQPVSVAFYEALGPERARLAFANGGRDATHHNAYGAYQLALAVAHGLRATGLPVARHLAADLPAFEATRPSPPESFALQFEPDPATGRLRGD